MKKTISFDFDGVIHLYSQGYKDGTIYDTNIDHSIATIHALLQDDHSVFILSSRDAEQIQQWLTERYPELKTEIIADRTKFWNKTGVVGITNRKLPAHVYIDDRALTFRGKFNGDFYNEIINFETWLDKAKKPKKICDQKDEEGSCPLHNLHCQWPLCEQ